MYTLMSDAQKEKFRMVSVATPASYVKVPGQTSPYVTVAGDYVIGPIPNSLSANAFGFGHTFIGTYLNLGGGAFGDGSNSAPPLIASHVKSAYDNLRQTSTCAEYEFTRVWMRSFGVLNVYGNVDGEDELVGEVTLEKSEAILDSNNNRYVCEGEDSFYWGDDNYSGQNWTYNYEDDRVSSWIPGQYITSRSYLDNISSIKEVVRKDAQCVTITLEKDSDLYAVIYDMFPE